MLNTTTVTFAGNLAADPELRFTSSGKAVVEVRVIVNRRVRNDAGDGYTDAEPTAWSCTIWGSPGENVAESLAKGDRVLWSPGGSRPTPGPTARPRTSAPSPSWSSRRSAPP